MQVQRLRICLWLAGTLLYVSAGLVLAWGWLSPGFAARRPAASRSPRTSRGEIPTNNTPSLTLQDFERVYSRQLRRPLFDVPSPVVKPVVKRPTTKKQESLKMKLIGTILEPDRTVAMFSTAAGKIEFKRVGESVGTQAARAEVVEIQRNRVLVRYADRVITFELGLRTGR